MGVVEIIFWGIVAFVYGSVFSSFATLVGYRVGKGVSIVKPPSACSSCGHRLGVLDLIPVLSYLIGRGKCRYCGVKYGSFHMWLELVVGLEFMLLYIFLFEESILVMLALMFWVIISNILLVDEMEHGFTLHKLGWVSFIITLTLLLFLQSHFVTFIIVQWLMVYALVELRRVLVGVEKEDIKISVIIIGLNLVLLLEVFLRWLGLI